MGSGRDFLLSLIPASAGLPGPFSSAAETRFIPGRGAPRHPRFLLCLYLGEKRDDWESMGKSACAEGDRIKGGRLQAGRRE